MLEAVSECAAVARLPAGRLLQERPTFRTVPGEAGVGEEASFVYAAKDLDYVHA